MKRFLFISLLLLTSCVTSSIHNKYAFFKGTFLKIEKKVTVTACNPRNKKQCLTQKYMSTASSFLIKHKKDKSYLMTAAHVCHTDYGKLVFLPKFQVKEEFYGLDFDMKRVEYKIYSMDLKSDLCIVTTKRLDAKPYKIAGSYPDLGSIVYNIAAPMGIFEKNIIPLFTGRYSGSAYDRALFTIPAVGGSSGSPILNKRGNVIGVVSAVTIKFNQIVISPNLEQIHKIVETIK
tara:strand:- start:255 stop:953 length:699 start_codon:yes stop_codon:yes gene_type:complete